MKQTHGFRHAHNSLEPTHQRSGPTSMTSTAQAIKSWEAKTGIAAADAAEVKLYCQVPAITKLDSSLSALANCEWLSLSTNQIDRMVSLAGMRKLRILSLGRNQIKKIEKLEDVAETLEELWLSYNLITSLDGLAALGKLTTLYMSNNQIKAWAELDKLAGLPNLREVLFVGNPIYEGLTKEEAKVEVLRRLPGLKKVDGEIVTPADLDRAGTAAGANGGGSGNGGASGTAGAAD